MKRAFDVIVAMTMLILLSPIILGTALLVAMKFGRPILFTQSRAGLHGSKFRMFKFRTMLDVFDGNGNALPDRDRLTNFGRILRATSLDELPELINVVRGDMSIVGPRPLLMEYLPLYTVEQSRRHELRPGLTGWAQIKGRNSLSWEEKFRLDVWYVDNRSFLLDLRIILATAWQVVRPKGVNAAGEATMPFFKGSDHG